MINRSAIERVWSAFETYRTCVHKREKALDNRRHYGRKGHFGIAVHDDRYAKEWQKWDRRIMVVEQWFREHFYKEGEI